MTDHAGMTVPAHWPSAWPHLWQPARDRAVFVAAVAALTLLGLAVTGDPRAQWWVPLVPVVLLTGPGLRPYRIRAALERSAVRGRLSGVPGHLLVTAGGREPDVWLTTSSGHTVPVPVARAVARALAERHTGEAALLVWAPRTLGGRGAAALVLAGVRVAYLRAVPTGVRPVDLRLRPAAGTAVLAEH